MKKNINLPEGLMLLLGVSIVVIIATIAMPMMAIKASSKENPKPKIEDGVISKNTSVQLDGESTVKVFITAENKVEEVDLEEYIISVVSSEMPANFETEALKAQAIAARTYLATKKVKPCEKASGGEICDSIHCQVYMNKESRIEKWAGSDGKGNWEKIKEAVDATKGKVLSYNGELVMYPQFFSTSSGKTEKAIDVFSNDLPYLVSAESSGEEIAPKFETDLSINIDEFINIINTKYNKAGLTRENIKSNIEIISRSESGGVKEIRIGTEKIKGTDFRMLLKLNSTNFKFEITESEVKFSCKGYGHGVGMSQWGANVMAKEGQKYDYILKHYYTGVDIVDLEFK
ncbi:stage II sporulation protein D [Clostridium gasigenes]|uniref:stage II sporulation protein D n=1 Tax=Clostridium gasigenes TaxID=94869 RepID=UPI001FD262D8|nr:stage II sporulation protein D [Clostridium gasigenes]